MLKTIAPPPRKKAKSQSQFLRQRWPEFYQWRRENRDGLVFPMPAKESTNASFGGHWRTRKDATDAFLGQCDTLKSHGLMPPPPDVPPLMVRMRVTMFVARYNDDGNAVGRLKRIEDWLTRNGYIFDDSRKHLKLEMPEQFLCGKTPQRVVVELEVLET